MKAVVAGALLFCWATTAVKAAESYSELVQHFVGHIGRDDGRLRHLFERGQP